MNNKPKLEDIVSLCKRRGFIYPSSEIYGGLAGVYDYGPLGVKLKHNIQNIWWSSFVSAWEDMYPMDAAILMHPKVWDASGHVDTFHDPLVECSNCHARHRREDIKDDKCPNCGKKDTLGKPRQFNMMFKTFLGPTSTEMVPQVEHEVGKMIVTMYQKEKLEYHISSLAYLRPETAQGMFVNFKNILDTLQPGMPFGLAQIGKAFRNEISPRDFLFRLREMEQMEIEYFVQPDKWESAFEEWKDGIASYFKKIGVDEAKTHAREVAEDERAHYSQRTIDFEFDFPFGTKELAGLAYRGDYDLKKHQEASGTSMQYQPKDGGQTFIPHVVEPSFGVERTILALLCSAYSEDEQGGEKRTYLKLPAEVAPIKAAVFPLLKNKPELVEKAREVYKVLKDELGEVMWDDNGNIGKRYRRQDEIGTPHCVTIDFQTLDDDTVTVRNRDTTEQQRAGISELLSKL